jgi:hypothetical protein
MSRKNGETWGTPFIEQAEQGAVATRPRSRLALYFTRPSVTLTSRVLLYNFIIPGH